MAGGFKNKPKILRGAFVEYGLSIPPLFVVFQFNPDKLTRNRTVKFTPPSDAGTSDLRQFHQFHKDLLDIRDYQNVTLDEETISFEIRLDATDNLDEGDFITQEFGITPQLSALEMMVHPKGENILDIAISSLLSSLTGYSFTSKENPPLVLFVWGRKRVLPVNITSMNITETEFSTDLNPIRATASVSLNVIEGPNPAYLYSKTMKEVMASLNLANIKDIANIVIPV